MTKYACSTPPVSGAPNFAISGFATIGDGDGPYRPRNYGQGALLFLQPGNQSFAPNWGRAGIELPRSLFPADKKNFGSRFGFAYRHFRKTVVRGGRRFPDRYRDSGGIANSMVLGALARGPRGFKG